MKKYTVFSRRNFIKHTAAVTGATSVSTSLVERALAEETDFKRVIFWYVPEGCAQQAFWPADTGKLEINMNASIDGKNPRSRGGSIRDYIDRSQATYCLQPLQKYIDKIALYSGFKNNGSTHKDAVTNSLTGSTPSQGSIDQILGREMRGTSPTPSMYAAHWGHHAVPSGANNEFLSPVRDTNGRTLGSSNWNPVDTFQDVFKNGIPNQGNGAPGVVPYGRSQSALAMLNAMEARLEVVKCVGGAEARDKYETLLASYRSLEERIAATLKADEDAAQTTSNITVDIPPGWENTDGQLSDRNRYWNKSANFERLMDISIDTTVAAFALDRTRVSMMQFSGSGDFRGTSVDDGLHYSKAGIQGLEGDQVHDHAMGHNSEALYRRNQARIFRWYYEKLAQLIEKLEATPDAGGKMLMDNTLIVTVTEFSMFDHRTHDMPYMTVGSLNGTLKTGQYLNVSNGNNFRSHADFLFGITRALDVNLPQFGTSTTPYTGLFN